MNLPKDTLSPFKMSALKAMSIMLEELYGVCVAKELSGALFLDYNCVFFLQISRA